MKNHIKNKISVIFSIFLIVFTLVTSHFWWENFQIFGNFSHTHPYAQYNYARILAQNEHYEAALKSLPEDISPYNGQLYELFGDLLYVTKSGTGEILQKYYSSLIYEKNPRVEEKIAILEGRNNVSNENSIHKEEKENTGNTKETPEEIKKKEVEIQNDEKNRQNFIHSASQNSFQDDLEYFKNILSEENTSEKKDW